MLKKVRDVVVVGGGVMGCSVAYHLAKQARVKVTVVERSFAVSVFSLYNVNTCI